MAHDLYFQENTIEQLLEVIATNEFPKRECQRKKRHEVLSFCILNPILN